MIACVGNTAGEVEIWILPGLHCFDFAELPQSPACVYCGNQAGANSVSIAFLDSMELPRVVVATGGDDQAITCAVLSLVIDDDYNSKLNVTLETIVTGKECCASAIKGVRVTGNQTSGFRLFAVGYDQRLSIWHLNIHQDPDSTRVPLLRYLSSTPVDVKDINSLDHCTLQGTQGREKEYLIAGGEGMEMLSFDKDVGMLQMH